MKNRNRNLNSSTGKLLNVDSKAKIYVPISINQNVKPPQPQQNTQINNNDYAISQLKKANTQLKEKQEIYIDKLIKLEQGLEKQHEQFMQLQDLYNQLFSSYKRKEQQISQLEQKYRQSNRKKQSQQIQNQLNMFSQSKNLQQQIKKQCQDQKQIIEKMEQQISQLKNKNVELHKSLDKANAEITYYKNKNRMIDSRASLNSKVFEQLQEWQKQADSQKQQKIKLQYENKFLQNRNDDLEKRIGQLQQIISQKQQQILKLRQNNIVLTRQNSENKLLRSTSKSPRKNQQKQNSNKKENSQKSSKFMDSLYLQNKQLKEELNQLKKKHAQFLKVQPKNQYFIRQQQFYSFSQDDHSNHSSNQQAQGTKLIHKQLFIKVQNEYEINKETNKQYILNKKTELKTSSSPQNNPVDDFLQQLPQQLQIDNLISKNNKKQNLDF